MEDQSRVQDLYVATKEGDVGDAGTTASKKKGHSGPRKRHKKHKNLDTPTDNLAEEHAPHSQLQMQVLTESFVTGQLGGKPSLVQGAVHKPVPHSQDIKVRSAFMARPGDYTVKSELSAEASTFIYMPEKKKHVRKRQPKGSVAVVEAAPAPLASPPRASQQERPSLLFYDEDKVDEGIGVLGESWYDLQQSWIFSKHAGSLTHSAPQSPLQLLMPKHVPGGLNSTHSGIPPPLDVPMSPLSSIAYLRQQLQLPPLTPQGGASLAMATSQELWQEQQERKKWSAWAVQAAEKERERRVQESKLSEEREFSERRARVQWAISAVETERQERLMKNYLSTLSSTSWFNELVSNFSDDYELVCPYYYFGCTERCYRSNINEHLRVCKYKNHEDEIIHAQSRLKSQLSGKCYEERPGSPRFSFDYEAVCPNTILGCSFTGSLADLQKHLTGFCRYQGQTQEQEMQQRALVQQQVAVDVEAERERRRLRNDQVSLQPGLAVLLGNQIQETLRTLHLHALDLWNECKVFNEQRILCDTSIQMYLKKRIGVLWPHSRIEAIGSSATGLYYHGLFRDNSSRSRSNSADNSDETRILDSPSSDLDLVVCFSDDMQSILHSESSLIRMLATFLEGNEGHEAGNSSVSQDGEPLQPSISISIQQVLTHAQVPLLKATAVVRYAAQNAGEEDRVVMIPVDISMDGPRNTGIASTAMIKMLLVALPPLGPVFLVLKEFLRCKGLTNPYTGGLGSYGLILMVLLPLLKQLRQVPDVPHEKDTQEALDEASELTPHPVAADTKWKLTKSSEKIGQEGKSGKSRSVSFSYQSQPLAIVPEEPQEPERIRRKSTGSARHPEKNRWQNVQAQKEHGLRMGIMLVSNSSGVGGDGATGGGADSPKNSPVEPLLKLESPICGVVIEEFLRYYGEEMQCGIHGFSVREGGFRFDLVSDNDTNNNKRTRTHPRAGDSLVIEDPIDVMSNVSQNCYRAVAIQKAFLDALDVFRGMSVRSDSRTLKAHVQVPRVVAAGNAKPIVRSRTSANVTALSRALSAALGTTTSVASDPHHHPPPTLEQKASAMSSTTYSAPLLEEMFCLTR